MSATNQTTPYGLPQYIEDDQPEMPDLNGAFKTINDALVSMQGVRILGYYDTLGDLQSAVISPAIGDLYGVGIDPDMYAYVWMGAQWAQGQRLSVASGVLTVNGKEPDGAGNVALIPADVGAVPTSRKINGKALSEDVTLAAPDVGARPNDWLPTLAQVGGRGKNLADNPFFTVNQANNSGTFSTIGGYAIDRWKLTSGTVTINADKTLTLNGTLVQIREESLGVEFVTDVFCTSGTATISYNDTTKTITITSSGGTIKAVSLEEGTVSTLKTASGTLNHAPPKPNQELAKCQWYYKPISTSGMLGVAYTYSGGTLAVGKFNDYVEMRANPKIVDMATGTEVTQLRAIADGFTSTESNPLTITSVLKNGQFGGSGSFGTGYKVLVIAAPTGMSLALDANI